MSGTSSKRAWEIRSKQKPGSVLEYLLGLLLVLGCASHLGLAQSTDHTLKVLTYNIHHAEPLSEPGVINIKAIAKVITASGADLVGVQEVDVRTRRSGVDLDEAAELARLTGMHFYFSKSRDWEGGDYGIAILSKFPILHAENLPLPLEGGEHRSIAVITIEPAPGKKMLFSTTHLDLKASNRVLQVNFIKDYFSKHDLPTILTGDFNSTPESDTIRSLDQMFQRSSTSSGLTFPMDKPVKEIDYVMFRPAKDFTVKAHEVIPERYASDHRPVLVTLRY